tara:strand:+ start:595 stop:885 length:291 start_codon:yes stop_codon:yes gene_type:complete
MSDTEKIDIEYVAKLARIALSEEEKAKFSEQLGSILGYIEKLEELNTEGVEPTAHPHPMENIWQEDVVSSELSVEAALQNAPKQRQNMVVVPKVVE